MPGAATVCKAPAMSTPLSMASTWLGLGLRLGLGLGLELGLGLALGLGLGLGPELGLVAMTSTSSTKPLYIFL